MSAIFLKSINKGTMSFANEELFFANNSNIAIVGENGQGKTTLLRIVSGIVAPDSGIYKFDSKEFKFPLRKKNTQEWQRVCRKNIFYTEGNQFLYPNLSVKDNIEYYTAVGNYKPEEVYENLKKIGFREDESKNCESLSLGTTQKIVASMSLASNKNIIICDEPTLGMDTKSKEIFFEIASEKEKTFIISTNDTTILDKFDLFIICEKERISLTNDSSVAQSRM